MSEQHTKEPWSIDQYNNIMTPDGQLGLGGVVTHCTWGEGMRQDRENARRIVACVNACAGIKTEFLELYGPNFGRAFIREAITANEQRDQLQVEVEALEFKVGCVKSERDENMRIAKESIDQLQAALSATVEQRDRLLSAAKLGRNAIDAMIGDTDPFNETSESFACRALSEAIASIDRQEGEGK